MLAADDATVLIAVSLSTEVRAYEEQRSVLTREWPIDLGGVQLIAFLRCGNAQPLQMWLLQVPAWSADRFSRFVELTCDVLPGGDYSLTMNNIKDTAGNMHTVSKIVPPDFIARFSDNFDHP